MIAPGGLGLLHIINALNKQARQGNKAGFIAYIVADYLGAALVGVEGEFNTGDRLAGDGVQLEKLRIRRDNFIQRRNPVGGFQGYGGAESAGGDGFSMETLKAVGVPADGLAVLIPGVYGLEAVAGAFGTVKTLTLGHRAQRNSAGAVYIVAGGGGMVVAEHDRAADFGGTGVEYAPAVSGAHISADKTGIHHKAAFNMYAAGKIVYDLHVRTGINDRFSGRTQNAESTLNDACRIAADQNMGGGIDGGVPGNDAVVLIVQRLYLGAAYVELVCGEAVGAVCVKNHSGAVFYVEIAAIGAVAAAAADGQGGGVHSDFIGVSHAAVAGAADGDGGTAGDVQVCRAVILGDAVADAAADGDGGPGKVDDGAGVAVNAVSGAADDAQGAAGYVEACAGIDYNAVLSSGSVPVMAAGHVGQAHGTAGKLQAHAIGNAEAVGKAECKGTAEAEILAESIPLGPGGGAVGQQDDGLPGGGVGDGGVDGFKAYIRAIPDNLGHIGLFRPGAGIRTPLRAGACHG